MKYEIGIQVFDVDQVGKLQLARPVNAIQSRHHLRGNHLRSVLDQAHEIMDVIITSVAWVLNHLDKFGFQGKLDDAQADGAFGFFNFIKIDFKIILAMLMYVVELTRISGKKPQVTTGNDVFQAIDFSGGCVTLVMSLE